ncbi:MAG: exodeoxyribonuclease VII small subunit [Acholeplasmatales bacterium]|nr:exodeoxyribonuclease VII small subunit [Acholeplasmatales bacterium]
MENKELTFEDYLTELENILKKLEDKDISLEEAVKGYTKGVELSKKCYEILEANTELVTSKMTDSGLVKYENE